MQLISRFSRGRDGQDQARVAGVEARKPRRSKAFSAGMEALEDRKVMSTFTVANGIYRADVETFQFSPTDSDIRARLFRFGVQVGTVTVANTTRNESDAAASLSANGRLAVSFTDQVSATNQDIKVAVLDLNGTPRRLTTQTVANSTKNEFDSSVSINNSGQFVVGYTLQFSTSDLDVKARRFTPTSSTGTTYSTSDFNVDSATKNQFDSSVRIASNGNFAVSYTHRFSSTDLDIKVAVFQNGVRRVATVANTGSNETASILESYNGLNNVTVSWLRGGTRFRRNLNV